MRVIHCTVVVAFILTGSAHSDEPEGRPLVNSPESYRMEIFERSDSLGESPELLFKSNKLDSLPTATLLNAVLKNPQVIQSSLLRSRVLTQKKQKPACTAPLAAEARNKGFAQGFHGQTYLSKPAFPESDPSGTLNFKGLKEVVLNHIYTEKRRACANHPVETYACCREGFELGKDLLMSTRLNKVVFGETLQYGKDDPDGRCQWEYKQGAVLACRGTCGEAVGTYMQFPGCFQAGYDRFQPKVQVEAIGPYRKIRTVVPHKDCADMKVETKGYNAALPLEIPRTMEYFERMNKVLPESDLPVFDRPNLANEVGAGSGA